MCSYSEAGAPSPQDQARELEDLLAEAFTLGLPARDLLPLIEKLRELTQKPVSSAPDPASSPADRGKRS
ncbi:hypothetical protein GCM10023184_21740 [Flaviaesturariibacter amylovorans]|uniref:Anti-sigma factor NepR domain-containing protein n=1 Tax=Flaviaesturariibacter amylovorans TaxID=1084520 RepID=A0ABP8GWJ7_9BACT